MYRNNIAEEWVSIPYSYCTLFSRTYYLDAGGLGVHINFRSKTKLLFIPCPSKLSKHLNEVLRGILGVLRDTEGIC